MDDRDELLVRWELGLCDEADEAALAALLADPRHRRAFLRQAQIAAALTATPSRTRSVRPVLTRPRHRLLWAMAASLVILAGLAALALRQDGSAARLLAGDGVRIEAADGTSRTVLSGALLADGDTVVSGTAGAVIVLARDAARLELDPRTRLTLPGPAPADAPLRLTLDSGGVLAEVAPRRPGAPLSIAAQHAIAEVVGTRFRLSTRPADDRLEVSSGTVRFTAGDGTSLLLASGQAASVVDGVLLPAPTASPERALPPGAVVLWRADPAAPAGWLGMVDEMAENLIWRSVAVGSDNPWAFTELRSPIAPAGWSVDMRTWITFEYWTSGFDPRQVLAVHLKPQDESNYAAEVPWASSAGWHQVILRIDRDFHHIGRQHEAPPVGERIHGVVWSGLRVDGIPDRPARFWIRNAVVYRTAGN